MRLTLALLLAASAFAQTTDRKILLFVNRTYISRPYLAKEIGKSCPDVRITQDRDRAQFRMDHDFGHGGWMGNEIALYDKSGDLVTTVYAKQPKNAIKDLCAAIETARKN